MRSNRFNSGRLIIPQAAPPVTMMRYSSSWPTRTVAGTASALSVNPPTPPRNSAGRPSARHRSDGDPYRPAPSRPIAEPRPNRGNFQGPGSPGHDAKPTHEQVGFGHHPTDPAGADRLQVGADRPDIRITNRGPIDLGPLLGPDHAHLDLQALPDEVRPRRSLHANAELVGLLPTDRTDGQEKPDRREPQTPGA